MSLFLEVASFFIAFWAMAVSFRIIFLNPGESIYRSFFVIGILCGLYGFFYGLMYSIHDIETVRVVYRVSVLSWGAFPGAFLVFLKKFTCQIRKKKFSGWFYLVYIPSLLLIIFGLTGNLLAKNFRQISLGWQELDLYTTYYDLFYLIVICLTLMYGCFELVMLLIRIKDRRKLKLSFNILIPMLVAFCLTGISNLVLNSVETVELPPLGHFWLCLFIIGIGYYTLKVPFLKFSSKLLADDILEMMTDIYVVADSENHILKINRAGLIFFGIRSSRTGRYGRNYMKMQDLLEEIEHLPDPGESIDGIFNLKGGDGKKIPHEVIIESITDYFDRPQGFFLIAKNAEEIVKLEKKTGRLKSMNTRLKTLSETDPLTGLFNRMKFHELLEREIKKSNRYKHPLSVIMFDLDDFKKVNDKWGHPAGDQVLIAVAECAKSSMREPDSVCRWGGEEFMILCPHSDMRGTRILAERLKDNICKIRVGEICNITASFGVSELRAGEDKEIMLERADKRLYQAKERGKNVVVGKS